MKRHHLMIPLLAANLMTFGCAGMDDQERTRAEGTTAGAVIGSLLGYAIGEERGAAVGAALGAGAGYAIGNEVAKRKQAYASTENFLDGEIARVQEFNQTTVAYNQQVRAEIARLQAQAGRMERRVASGEMARVELQGERDAIAQRLEKSEALEKSLAREIAVQQRILVEERGDRPYNDPYLAQLTKEVAELQRNLNQLRDDSAQLASIDGRLSV